ncbi:MAG: DUF2750 domain-containing protein [Bacteroidales bacterium]|nr:DUF2750 domain-containing protein [Bacteroidales bacterium]
MEKLEQFINVILATRKVWLLEAKEGFFAMMEDGNGDSYVPLWTSEELALKAAKGDWDGYTVTTMGFSELANWLKELANDEIDIAVSPEDEGEITAIPSAKFRNWLKPYDDHSYKEKDDEAGNDDDFDYGDGWAEPWSDQ